MNDRPPAPSLQHGETSTRRAEVSTAGSRYAAELDPGNPHYDAIAYARAMSTAAPAWTAESRNDAWAARREASIKKHLDVNLATLTGSPSIQDIDCHQMTCKVVVEIDLSLIDTVTKYCVVMVLGEFSTLMGSDDSTIKGRELVTFYLAYPPSPLDESAFERYVERRVTERCQP